MKLTVISIIVAIVLVGGTVLLTKSNPSQEEGTQNNVSVVDGKQIISIRARGGYAPRKTVAQAGIPTILKVDASGTVDCSSAIRIPSLNITKNLPLSGTTDINLGTPAVGTLQGMCAMGMYSFRIDFQG